MDNKTWLWRKKSTEKTIVAADNVSLSLKGNEEEIQALLSDKAELEKDMKNLNDKLTSAFSESNAKDELVKKHAKMAQEAVASLEKAEAESISLKQELDEALHQIVIGEERLAHLDSALKECMQQLRFVREDQEQRIHDVMTKTSKEFEKSKMVLEEKLAETGKRLAKIAVENSQLSKSLSVKEQMIEDLNEKKTQVEADLNTLMARLDSTERDNASLKYEVRVLEKELEIRNEEREFNRRTADATNKQQLDSVKKISKLESECQRLRVLVRKRLPGPAALAKMRNEVEMLGNDSVEMRRRRLSSSPTGSIVGFAADNSTETPRKRVVFLTEQLCALEEENKTLKEALDRKTNELQLSHIRHARTTSRLSQVESRLEESSKGQAQAILEPSSSLMSHEMSLTSVSDIGSDDKVSCSESWASALISELEHFRSEKQKGLSSSKTVGALDLNLMDDFLEMEKLAIVSVDNPSGCSPDSSNVKPALITAPLEIETSENSSEVTGREIVLVPDSQPAFGASHQEVQSIKPSTDIVPSLIQDRLKVLLDQNHVKQRSPEVIVKDIRAASADTNHPTAEIVNGSNSSNLLKTSNSSHVNGYISLKPLDKSSSRDSPGVVNDVNISLTEKSNSQFQSDLSKSIFKIIELIDGIILPSKDCDNPQTLSRKDGTTPTPTPTGYIVRVFQWKSSEVAAVLQQFVHTCYDLLNGKADLNRFSRETAASLDWIINHCFSIQDVSSMRDEIKKQFDWEESPSENEAEVGMLSHFSEADKLRVPRDQMPWLPSTPSNCSGRTFQAEDPQSDMIEENRKLRNELLDAVSSKKDLEGRLQSASSKSESLLNQLRESEHKIASLEAELESSKVSRGKVEEQIENQKLVNEDLEAQLTASRAELTEAYQKFSSLEAELENKSSCYEELEATCVELQLQLESVTKKENPNFNLDEDEKPLQTGWEISAASEKLAECRETILNLGKQLKALAAPKEAALFDKAITTPTESTMTPSPPKNNKSLSHGSSLLDRMIAEDGTEATKNLKRFSFSNVAEHPGLNGNTVVGSRAIVPIKKQGSASLWRKLLWRRKKGNGKKTSFPFQSR